MHGGRLALPNLQSYYLASQLIHIHGWFFPEIMLQWKSQATLMHLYEALINLLYRNGPHSAGAAILKLSF